MNKIRDSVIRARDSNAALSDRHAAFGELVCRFQDMAFAYAFAVLGDAYLAEDVAQDAFVSAWHKLGQLREPDAFPGWFKRIVKTQCNRLLRSRRLQFVESESAIDKKSELRPFDHSVEDRELVRKVLIAIQDLPEKQRLVSMLFYVNGYSQHDIGRFLDLPISTVNKRLYTAREKLKVTMLEAVKSDLQKDRPSRNHNFSSAVNARLRPLKNEDWTAIGRLVFDHPSDISGKELWLSSRRNVDTPKYVRRQYVAEHSATKRILGFGAIEQTIYLPRYKLFLVAGNDWLRKGVGELLVKQLIKDLYEVNAITVTSQEYASNATLVDFLKENGFEEVTKLIDSRLDLQQMCMDSLISKLKTIGNTGITFSTLTHEWSSDPMCVEKLHHLNVALLKEHADQLSFSPPSYDAVEARLWLEMSYVLADGYFIAKHGNRYVGVLNVNLRETLPRGVTLNAGGVLPEYRRRGIGTGLMLRAIAYAKANGYTVMRTFNRPVEESLLRLNSKMGFRTEFALTTLERCLKPVVQIKRSSLFDEYAGSYYAERPFPLDIRVKHESNRLTGECRGQKVELFPSSETEFFIKPFYGEVKFVRGKRGQVTHLNFAQRTKDSFEEFKAVKLPETKTSGESS